MAFPLNACPNSVFGLGSRTPDIAVHGTESTAPAGGTVLADTGPIGSAAVGQASGQTLIPAALVGVAIASDDFVPAYEIAHRNAANSADVDVIYIAAGDVSASVESFFATFKLKPGERIVVRNKTAGTAAKIYQVELYVYQIPV